MKKLLPYLICVVVVCIIAWFDCGPIKKDYVTNNTIVDTLVIYKDANSANHALIKYNPEAKQELKNAISKEFYSYTTDTLAPALQIAQKEIDRLIRINAKLKGIIEATSKDTVEKKTIYEGPYMKIVTINDSAAQYSYNAELNFIDYHKKSGFLGRDLYYTDISSPDTSFTIYGVQTYRRYFTPVKDKVAVSAVAGLSIGHRASFHTGLRLRFNPDGIISPYAGAGREFFFRDRPSYYVQGGIELNLYRK